MIPTMIVVGLLVGVLPRPWYLLGVGVASVGWALALVATGVIGAGDTLNILGAVALALVNVLIGLGVTRGMVVMVRAIGRGT